MSMMNTKAVELSKSVNSAKIVLTLLFPQYQLTIMPNLWLFNRIDQQGKKEQVIINNDNYEQFRSIIKKMFCLDVTSQQSYNPANKKAAQIAKKLEQRKKRLSQKKDSNKQINILYHYVSVLTLGNHHTIPQLMEYTVYQLFNEFQRFEKKFAYDTWFSAKLAGAENLEDVDNWLLEEEDFAKSQEKPRSNRIEF